MRKLIMIAVLALFASSCAHAPRGGDLRTTRDSVYKVRVALTLDLTPLNEWIAKKAEQQKKKDDELEQKRKDEEQKQQKKAEKRRRTPKKAQKKWPWNLFNEPTPVILNDVEVALSPVQEMTDLRIISQTRDTAVIGWSGTGWVSGHAPGRSYVMTAGHVCESRDVYPIEVFDINWETGDFEVVTINLPITKKEHLMIGRDGIASENSTIIRDEDMGDDFNGNDLCMLGLGADLGSSIPVADEDPEYGQTCSIVGAPTGLWGGGIAVASEALYSGRGAVFGTEPDGLAFNGLLAPGNSGSAVVCDGQVVGVISLGATRFRSLIQAVPQDRIRTFMRKAFHQGD